MAATGAFLRSHRQSVGEHTLGSSSYWSRSFSANDVIAMRRTPTRRFLDSRQPREDILSPDSTMEVLQPQGATDPGKR